MHEDSPPNIEATTMAPPPSDTLPDTERPNAKTDPTPVHAIPDRTDEILAAIARLERASVDRDRMLADSILALDRSVRDETNAKIDGVALHAQETWGELKQEIRTTVLILDEQRRGDMADSDRRWDARVTTIAGEQRALATVVGEGFASLARELEKVGKVVGSVLTHVAQSGGQKIAHADESADADEAHAVTRSR